MDKKRKIGAALLAAGSFMLLMGIVFGFTTGTIAVPILVSSSVFVNTAGVTLLMDGGRRSRNRSAGLRGEGAKDEGNTQKNRHKKG